MKSADPVKTSAAQVQTKKEDNPPFFQKEGAGGAFSSGKAFFAPQGGNFFSPKPSSIQAQMTVGAADDPYEQEAEKVSRQVVAGFDSASSIQRKISSLGLQTSLIQPMPIGTVISRRLQRTPIAVQAKCDGCEQEEKLAQPKSLGIQLAGDGAMVSPDIEARIQSQRGSGQAMDAQTKGAMESSFGADFNSVRVHTGSPAVQMSQQLNAHAFTVGNDIFFNQGRYQPQSKAGAGLLAHELTHTVQQGAAVQNKRINRQSLLSSLSDHTAAHLSAMNSGESPALSRKEIAQLETMPEEEMKMQQLKGVDEVQRKDSSLSLRRCPSSPPPAPYKKGEILGVNTKNKQGWVTGFIGSDERAFPDFLKVEYIEQKMDGSTLRDFFKVLEGPYAGKNGKLKTGYLEKKTWGSPVNVVFDSKANKVNYGAGEADATMQQKPGSSMPLLPADKTFNLMLPDFPHSGNYGDYSSVWFRIEGGPQGDEYFHRGSVSWGCISVTEDKWPTIYNHVINKRSGTKYVGTAKRV